MLGGLRTLGAERTRDPGAGRTKDPECWEDRGPWVLGGHRAAHYRRKGSIQQRERILPTPLPQVHGQKNFALKNIKRFEEEERESNV